MEANVNKKKYLSSGPRVSVHLIEAFTAGFPPSQETKVGGGGGEDV